MIVGRGRFHHLHHAGRWLRLIVPTWPRFEVMHHTRILTGMHRTRNVAGHLHGEAFRECTRPSFSSIERSVSETPCAEDKPTMHVMDQKIRPATFMPPFIRPNSAACLMQLTVSVPPLASQYFGVARLRLTRNEEKSVCRKRRQRLPVRAIRAVTKLAASFCSECRRHNRGDEIPGVAALFHRRVDHAVRIDHVS